MERQRRSLIFSPGLRALARYPVKRNAIFGVTLKGLPRFFFSTAIGFCELLQSSHLLINAATQGVALGWNLRTPPAFGLNKYVIAPPKANSVTPMTVL